MFVMRSFNSYRMIVSNRIAIIQIRFPFIALWLVSMFELVESNCLFISIFIRCINVGISSKTFTLCKNKTIETTKR